jgi:DNA-binding GntR family transcriptional regulator
VRVRDRISSSYAEHSAVVTAILNGDGETAAQLTREHVMIQGQRFADLMASLPQLRAAPREGGDPMHASASHPAP